MTKKRIALVALLAIPILVLSPLLLAGGYSLVAFVVLLALFGVWLEWKNRQDRKHNRD